MEPEKAKAPTTVEPLEVDAYVVDITSEENPFAKIDEDVNDDTDICHHQSTCSFQSTKSRRMRRTANEKKR